MTNKTHKLVPLPGILPRLALPGKKRSISQAAVNACYLPALKIKPVNIYGLPKSRTEHAYITAAQADDIVRLFRLLNWRSFRAAGLDWL
jgi:hypothetical protein